MNKLPHILPLAGNQSMGPVPVPATEIQMSKTPPVVKTAVSAGEQGKPGHVVKTCRLYDYKLDERLARQKGEISAKTQNVALEAKKHSTYESENSVEHIVEHSIATPECLTSTNSAIFERNVTTQSVPLASMSFHSCNSSPPLISPVDSLLSGAFLCTAYVLFNYIKNRFFQKNIK